MLTFLAESDFLCLMSIENALDRVEKMMGVGTAILIN